VRRAVADLALVLCALVVHGYGQSVPAPDSATSSGLRRWEAGFDAQDFHKGGNRTGECIPTRCSSTQFAAGIHASLNVNPSLAIESSLEVTPTRSAYDSGVNNFIEGGRATELLLGARGSVRTRRWGFFADADPGVLSWSHVLLGMTYDEPLTVGRRNSFAIDLGGGVEYSPEPRMRVRLGLGDLLVRSNDTYTITTPPPYVFTYAFEGHPWQNELRANANVSWEFGKPLLWTPPNTHQAPSHKFFDKTNFTFLTISLLGQASDAITTQRFLHHGASEGDPLARPFVDQGWPGQIGLAVLNNGEQLSLMYALHRMHKHWLERTVPLVFGGISAFSAYRNDDVAGAKRGGQQETGDSPATAVRGNTSRQP
jgi:hypothetical protein